MKDCITKTIFDVFNCIFYIFYKTTSSITFYHLNFYLSIHLIIYNKKMKSTLDFIFLFFTFINIKSF